MRIVITAHQFLPDHWSGTEIITFSVARHLLARGHEVVVVTGYPARATMHDNDRFDEYQYGGVRVVRFHHSPVPMGGQDNVIEAEYHNLLFQRFFTRWLAGYRPDIVHFMHLGRITSSAITACADCRIPAVFTATDFWLICPTNQLRLPDGALCRGPVLGGANCVRHIALVTQPPAVRERMARLPLVVLAALTWAIRRGLFRRTWYAPYVRSLSARSSFLLEQAQHLARIVVPSQVMTDMLVRNGVPRGKLTTIPYGIDLGGIVRNTDRGRGHTLRVAFVGTLSEHKGAHIAMEAVRRLPKHLPLELRVYGRTDEFPEYTALLREHAGADDRIVLCGPFDNSRIGAILAETDVLVCPSTWYENTPLVIYEAMAAGVPAIATNLRGMSEQVEHGRNGFLFAPGDARQLAVQLQQLAADREQLRTLAKGTMPPLSAQEHVSQLEELYEAVLSSGERPPAPTVADPE